ncbi:hypothetical protein BDR22DRAFT_892096 [Usnea florida]
MTSHSSEKVLKLREFEKELHSIISSMVNEAEKLQSTAYDPVVLDHAWISHKIKAVMVEDKFVLEPRALQAKEGLGALSRLPRELRDMIYGHAINDGNMAILQLSQQTHLEARPLVFEKGIYRMLIGFPDFDTNFQPDDLTASKIQNMHVRVNARSPIWKKEDGLAILRSFGSAFIMRNNCVVTIEADILSPHMTAVRLVNSLKGLTNFERVILETKLAWDGEPYPSTMAYFHKDQIRSRYEDAIKFQMDLLQPSLGIGERDEDTKEEWLAFHPREPRPLQDGEEVDSESQDQEGEDDSESEDDEEEDEL